MPINYVIARDVHVGKVLLIDSKVIADLQLRGIRCWGLARLKDFNRGTINRGNIGFAVKNLMDVKMTVTKRHIRKLGLIVIDIK